MKIRIQTLLSILSVIVAVLTVLRHTPGVVDAAPDLAWKVLAWAALAPTVLAVRELRRTGSAPAGEKTMGAVLILFCLGDVFPVDSVPWWLQSMTALPGLTMAVDVLIPRRGDTLAAREAPASR